MKILPMLDTVKVSLWSGAVLQEQKFLKAMAIRKKKTRIFYGAKLYYTSFWDKFGINVNYFGMHPKT